MDVGSGSGYLTACFCRFFKPTDDYLVIGIEHQPRLVELAIENMNNDDPNMLLSEKVRIIGELTCYVIIYNIFLNAFKY